MNAPVGLIAPVVLSLGYGKSQRLRGRVVSFMADPLICLDAYLQRQLRALFPTAGAHVKIACIEIELEHR